MGLLSSTIAEQIFLQSQTVNADWKFLDDINVIFGTDSDYLLDYNSTDDRWELQDSSNVVFSVKTSGTVGTLSLDGTTFVTNAEFSFLSGLDQALKTTDDVTFDALTVTSIAIGANILTTTEFAFLDGIDQAVKTTDSVLFDKIDLTGFLTLDNQKKIQYGTTAGYEMFFTGTTMVFQQLVGNWSFNGIEGGSNITFSFNGDWNFELAGDPNTPHGKWSTSAKTFDIGTATVDYDVTIFGTFTLEGNDLTAELALLNGLDQALSTISDVTFDDLTVTSIAIGANILTTTEFAFLDGIDQAVKTTDNVLFASVSFPDNNGILFGADNDFLMFYRSVDNRLVITDAAATNDLFTLLDGGTTGIISLDGGTNQISATELAILNGATLTTSELNILDGATVNFGELNILDGALLTTTELNFVDGVTSPIQTQLDTLTTAVNDASGGQRAYPMQIRTDNGATQLSSSGSNWVNFPASDDDAFVRWNFLMPENWNSPNTVTLHILYELNTGTYSTIIGVESRADGMGVSTTNLNVSSSVNFDFAVSADTIDLKTHVMNDTDLDATSVIGVVIQSDALNAGILKIYAMWIEET